MNNLAAQFIWAIPKNTLLPEIALDPDGDVCLDWTATKDVRLSVSVTPTGGLAYAWLDGTDHGSGVADFDPSRAIPPEILNHIRRVQQALHGDNDAEHP